MTDFEIMLLAALKELLDAEQHCHGQEVPAYRQRALVSARNKARSIIPFNYR